MFVFSLLIKKIGKNLNKIIEISIFFSCFRLIFITTMEFFLQMNELICKTISWMILLFVELLVFLFVAWKPNAVLEEMFMLVESWLLLANKLKQQKRMSFIAITDALCDQFNLNLVSKFIV